ncbi:Beta-lactamase family protein [Rhodovastum atsumiense]|uniref:Beta-lactamase family protein n=1 Tax=Rhodovastum atsumiense TaxID=504468 RepID=A0A5M6J272_9PROT|nr:serine hydrolase domain-containing protein [Rhodovastum atsumiense]KAA5614716.1 beta-lactamase family protein [Rhodovastum atsumiense]CAH2599747.1 Beta-lactamase family protein [Rhodovastum atsumiense]
MNDLDTALLRRRVDQLVRPWEAPGSPGVAVGVLYEGELAVHRCAGLASLELEVPVGPATTFRIASVSKHFTCAAVLMLAQEGRLDIDQEARHYLPELPDFAARITLAHLMHNVSGIRDMLEIMRQGGTDLDMPVTPEELLAGICRQRTLNFAPGSRYLYSNTGFLLLGMIVERVAGESLGSFLERRIFAPLGMNRTRLTPSLQDPAPGLATGYLPRQGGGFVRAAHAFPLGGEGGLVSCVEDLALWDRNFTTHRVGGPELETALTRQIEFSGGGVNPYARGLLVRHHRGVRTVGHGGLWPGYRTEYLRAPEREVTVICVTNQGASDPYHLAHDVLDAVLDGMPEVHPVHALPPRPALEELVGRWVDRDNAATVDISLDAAGHPMGSTHGVPFRLRATEDGRLEASRAARDFTCALAADGALAVELDAGVRATYCRAVPPPTLPEGLAGSYANAEIGATWTITETGTGTGRSAELRVSGPLASRRGPWLVEPVDGDIIRIWMPGLLFRMWLDVRVLRAGGRVSGLCVAGNRARRLCYPRQEDGARA